MTRTTEIAAKAILARFAGDSVTAICYCEDMAIRYPRMAGEYTEYKLVIAEMSI